MTLDSTHITTPAIGNPPVWPLRLRDSSGRGTRGECCRLREVPLFGVPDSLQLRPLMFPSRRRFMLGEVVTVRLRGNA